MWSLIGLINICVSKQYEKLLTFLFWHLNYYCDSTTRDMKIAPREWFFSFWTNENKLENTHYQCIDKMFYEAKRYFRPIYCWFWFWFYFSRIYYTFTEGVQIVRVKLYPLVIYCEFVSYVIKHIFSGLCRPFLF